MEAPERGLHCHLGAVRFQDVIPHLQEYPWNVWEAPQRLHSLVGQRGGVVRGRSLSTIWTEEKDCLRGGRKSRCIKSCLLIIIGHREMLVLMVSTASVRF